MKSFISKYNHLLILIFVLFVALPLLTLYMQRMFWDITLINLPWRYHLSECINNGELPLWNPYMNYGFPQMGHGETWYPVSWLIAFLFKYDLQVLQYEYLFNLLMAGLGFYKLAGLIDLEKPIKIAGAIAYMLCGVFIAQASHLGYLTSGAWMPFVFYFLIQFLRKPDLRIGLSLIFFYFLLATGGYPGNIIVISYICLAILLYHLFTKIKSNNKIDLIKYAYLIPFLFLLFACTYAVVFYSTLDVNSIITRGELEYSNQGFGAMTGSVTFNSYASLVSPLSTAIDDPIWGTSRMLNDSYFGVLPLVFGLFYLINGRKHQLYKLGLVLFFIALFFFSISLALELPVHKILFDYLPLINKFRFPSLYRIFFIVPMILIALFGIQLMSTDKKQQKQFILWLLFICLGFICLLPFSKSISFSAFFGSFEEKVLSLSLANMLYLDILIGLGIVILLITSLLLKVKQLIWCLIVLISLDLVVHTWIRTPIFVARNTDPGLVDDAIALIPEGFPLINQEIAMKDAVSQFENVPPLWTNRYSYFKYPLYEGSSPYATKSFAKSIENGDLENALDYPFIAVFDQISEQKMDSTYYNAALSHQVKSTQSTPNQFDFKLENSAGKYLVFNHNMSRHWQIRENEELLDKFVVSTNFLAVKLKSNTSDLQVKFEPVRTIQLFYLSAFSFIFLLVLILVLNVRYFLKNKNLDISK